MPGERLSPNQLFLGRVDQSTVAVINDLFAPLSLPNLSHTLNPEHKQFSVIVLIPIKPFSLCSVHACKLFQGPSRPSDTYNIRQKHFGKLRRGKYAVAYCLACHKVTAELHRDPLATAH